jgi:molybdopterin-guanine dinucleotide biosynthesis protein A
LTSDSAVLGLILAGGLARRMGGGDKGMIELAGRSILERVIERLRPQVDELAINANGDPTRFAAYGVAVLPDTVPGFPGPLAGVLAGLEWANARGHPWLATLATDTPFFPRDLVHRFLGAIREQSADLACAASAGRAHPVVGLWPTRLASDLRNALVEKGVRKVDEWTKGYRLVEVDFPVRGYDPFFNTNRPEDLDEARQILVEFQP